MTDQIPVTKQDIITSILTQTGISISEDQLHKLNKEPIGHLSLVFDAYAAQAGEFGLHVYAYKDGKVSVHMI